MAFWSVCVPSSGSVYNPAATVCDSACSSSGSPGSHSTSCGFSHFVGLFGFVFPLGRIFSFTRAITVPSVTWVPCGPRRSWPWLAMVPQFRSQSCHLSSAHSSSARSSSDRSRASSRHSATAAVVGPLVFAGGFAFLVLGFGVDLGFFANCLGIPFAVRLDPD